MKQKLKNAVLVTKPFFRKVLAVVIITLAIVSSFIIGRHYDKIGNDEEEITNVVKVKKEQVNIAVDENNHLIIIDNKTGDYTIYQDSIGHTIFKLYARNIWSGQSDD